MLKQECGTCMAWQRGACTRIPHGLPCKPVVLKPGQVTWMPDGLESNFFTAPVGCEKVHFHQGNTQKANDTQVAGDHYKKMGVEPWDVVDTWPLEQRIGAYRHGALKYLMRMGSKDQNAQEIAKGKHYMEKLLEVLRESADEQAALKQGENTGSIA